MPHTMSTQDLEATLTKLTDDLQSLVFVLNLVREELRSPSNDA